MFWRCVRGFGVILSFFSSLFPFFFFSTILLGLGSLWVQLLLKFYTKLFFLTFRVFSWWSQDVMSFGYIPYINLYNFFSALFPLVFFFFFFFFSSGLITIRIHNLCGQLLQFSTVIMKFCRLSEDVHLFWGYSPFMFYQLCPLFRFFEGLLKCLKLTTLY